MTQIKAMAINPFADLDDVKESEIVTDIHVDNDPLEDILTAYLGWRNTLTQDQNRIYQTQPLSTFNIRTLSPQDIDTFLQIIRESDFLVGNFISYLISSSTKQGNKSFELNTKSRTIDHLCGAIDQSHEDPIDITINGDAGSCLGNLSSRCRIHVKGNVGSHLGWTARYCDFVVDGNAQGECGPGSQECTYRILGDAEESIGLVAKDCTFYIGGKIKKSMFNYNFKKSKDCLLEVNNFESYKRILNKSKEAENLTVRLREKSEMTDQTILNY